MVSAPHIYGTPELAEEKAKDFFAGRNVDRSSTVDAAPALIWSSLPDGTTTYISPRWLTYHGLSAEQALRMGWRSIIHPDDYEPYIARWHEAIRTGTSHEATLRIRCRDGEYRNFLARAAPVRDVAGHIIRWSGANVEFPATPMPPPRKIVPEVPKATPPVATKKVDGLRAALLSLATLLITIPAAVLGYQMLGDEGEVPFTLGIVWATFRFGWRGAFPLALASMLTRNFFTVPPVFAFTHLRPIEFFMLATWFCTAFSREAICAYQAHAHPVLMRLHNALRTFLLRFAK
jgi:PAS domain S-box-containing protein